MIKDNYDDIINLPHFVSKKRKPMNRSDRAVQFAAFKALSGFENEVAEKERFTDKKIVLTDIETRNLNEKLNILVSKGRERPEITVIYFKPDKYKSGGVYTEKKGNFKYIDEFENIIFTDGGEIPVKDLLNIIF